MMTELVAWAGAVTGVLALTGGLLHWKHRQGQYQQAREEAQVALVAHMRRSIAANLHDELGSLLMRVHMQAETIRHQPPPNEASLERLLATTQAALLAMRDVAWGLDPSADTVSALEDRMRDLLDQMSLVTVLCISFATENLDTIVAVPGWMRQEIYQVFKEAITNVMRHATGATCLAVRLYAHNGSLHLEIKDNGVPPTGPARSGMGLRNMSLRAEAVAGELRTGPRTDGPGFEVFLTVPVTPMAQPSWLRQWAK